MSRKKPSKYNRQKCSRNRRKKSKKQTKTTKRRKKASPQKANRNKSKENKNSPSDGKTSNNNNQKNESNKNKNAIQVERRSLMARRYKKFHDHFLTYNEIFTFCENTRKENESNVELVKIGNSSQGRPIIVVVIAGSQSDQQNPRLGAMIEAGLNGSNYMAISNAVFMIDYLVKNPNCLKLMDYYIVPCANPDGYEKFLESQKQDKQVSNNKKIDCRRPSKTQTSKSPEQTASDRKVQIDLSNNFPVLLGLNNMDRIQNLIFLEKIKIWKENFVPNCAEQLSIVRAVCSYQFALKLYVSLQEGGEQICYPFGFCSEQSVHVDDLVSIAKKGRCVMRRCFEYGSTFDLRGLTYGTLIDFIKIEKLPIKFTYTIHVNKLDQKSQAHQFQNDTKKILQYGTDIMNCIKAMVCGIYKTYNTSLEKKVVESTTKNINKKFC